MVFLSMFLVSVIFTGQIVIATAPSNADYCYAIVENNSDVLGIFVTN